MGRLAVTSTSQEGQSLGLADGLSLQRRVDRDRNMSRHPDGQIGHDPPGTVAREDGHPASRFPILRLQPGCDAADFGHSTAPGPIAHVAAAVGLCEENGFGPLALPFVDALKRQIVCTEIAWHRSSLKYLWPSSRRP